MMKKTLLHIALCSILGLTVFLAVGCKPEPDDAYNQAVVDECDRRTAKRDLNIILYQREIDRLEAEDPEEHKETIRRFKLAIEGQEALRVIHVEEADEFRGQLE